MLKFFFSLKIVQEQSFVDTCRKLFEIGICKRIKENIRFDSLLILYLSVILENTPLRMLYCLISSG